MPNNWFNYREPDDSEPSTPKKRYIPSAARLRQLAMESYEGGRFRCPQCGCSFSATFGVYGKTKAFEDPALYCRDCARANTNFRKVIK